MLKSMPMLCPITLSLPLQCRASDGCRVCIPGPIVACLSSGAVGTPRPNFPNRVLPGDIALFRSEAAWRLLTRRRAMLARREDPSKYHPVFLPHSSTPLVAAVPNIQHVAPAAAAPASEPLDVVSLRTVDAQGGPVIVMERTQGGPAAASVEAHGHPAGRQQVCNVDPFP